MDYLPLPGTPVEEIGPPAIIVDLDIAEANIKAMAAFASENGVSMRPHMKTGKSPFWALKQIEAGAIGRLVSCPDLNGWCRVEAGGRNGWLRRVDFWGVLRNEVME